MARPQSGICAEANLHGLHLFFNVLEGQDEAVRAALSKCERLQEELADRFSESMLSSFIAIGAQYWPHIYPEFIPPNLKSFPLFNDAEHEVHTQPFDLLYVIRSDREDVNHIFSQSVLHLLSGCVELVDHIKGFRFLDGRDFNGFIYGGDSPKGRGKRQVALYDNTKSPAHMGSYVHITRSLFDIQKWQGLTIKEQEQLMGRKRLDNDRLVMMHDHSHAHFNELKNNEGLPLVLNQNMPFGDVLEQGSLWISCSGNALGFETILKNRLGNHASSDPILDFMSLDMGAAFFAPSLDFLAQMAQKCD